MKRRLVGPRSFAQANKGALAPRRRVKAFDSGFAVAVAAALEVPKGKSKSKQGLSLPFGERVTFLCLCKEKITKRGAFQQPSGWSSTPCLRAHAATRRGSTPPAGFFDTTSLSWRKTTCIHARRPSGSSHWLRRCGRGPVSQSPKQPRLQLQLQLRKLPLPNPPLACGKGREQSCTWGQNGIWS